MNPSTVKCRSDMAQVSGADMIDARLRNLSINRGWRALSLTSQKIGTESNQPNSDGIEYHPLYPTIPQTKIDSNHKESIRAQGNCPKNH